MEKQEEIGALYDRLVAEGRKVVNDGKYERVDAKGIEGLSYCGKTDNGRYAPIKYVSRHKTSKNLVEITVTAGSGAVDGKDFHEFGCTEKQARELLHIVMEYFSKLGK